MMTRSKAYEVLGIESNASIEEIKTAYAELSKKYHPEENPKEFQEIHEAYISLVRQTRNYNRMKRNITFVENADIETSVSEITNENVETEKEFDFSGVDDAKQKKYEDELQNVIKRLDAVVYSDKKIDHVLLKVILAYKNHEIIYSKEFIEKFTEILQVSIVDEETSNVIRQYIRPWDSALDERREELDVLKRILEERNKEYKEKHYLEERQEIGKMMALVMMPVVLMLWLIINFWVALKSLFAFTVLGAIVFWVYKFCQKKATKKFSIMTGSFAGFLILLISYFLEFYKWITESNGAHVFHLYLLFGFGFFTIIFFYGWKKGK